MTSLYNEDYFLRGVSKKLSNYEDYRWLEERTVAFARRLVEVMNIKATDTFLDFGCALGFTVKAMRWLHIDAFGYDTSEWAVRNCDPEVAAYVSTALRKDRSYDHVLCKDVAEHLQPIELMQVVDNLIQTTDKSILFIVPLSKEIEGPYVREEDNLDVTHALKWPLEKWMDFMQNRIPGEMFSVSGSWHIPGLKPTSLTHLKSCGFISLRRVPG